MFSFLALLGDVNPSAPESSKVVLFNPTERMGVIIMAVAGVTSCTLVSILLLYIIGSALVLWSRKTQDRSGLFISKQIAIFLTCLLVSDLIQSISGITQVKWAIENQIYESRSCTIQAVTLVMGDLGSTVWSITIAAHTFTGIALGKHWPRWLVWTTVCTGWTFVIVLTFLVPLGLVETKRGPFFSIAGTWCFISSEYAVPRLVIHYVPLFVASALIIIFYGLIFRFLRRSAGFLRPQGSLPAVNDVLSRQRVAIAKRMLWYPVGSYILLHYVQS
ncbi:hypothetical protein K439DRAFT_313672 [Ramaria rubella]|nr:hypothetical protein K439DRAFT_313672 [Ramaria rubella]